MASPRTWQLLEAVRASLAVISKSAGYHTDAGSTVTVEPQQMKDDEPAVLAVMLEAMQQSDDPAARAISLRGCSIAIIGKVPVELDDAELRLHELIEDVEAAMKDQQRRYPTGTDFPRYDGMTRIPPADGIRWTGAIVRYTANIRR